MTTTCKGPSGNNLIRPRAPMRPASGQPRPQEGRLSFQGLDGPLAGMQRRPKRTGYFWTSLGRVSLALLATVAFGCAEETGRLDDAPAGDDAVDGEGGLGGDAGLVPIALQVTAADGALVLDWEPPADIHPVAYWVHYRATLPGPPWDGAGASAGASPVHVAGGLTATLDGLENGTAYYVAVAADLGGVPGPLSAWAMATPRRDAQALALVPAGVYWMGASPFVHEENEEPAHPVFLDAFWLDRYIATLGEYRACVDAGACTPPNPPAGFLPGVTAVDDYFGNPLYDSFPVVNLEHVQAADYCAWRGKRLPTEAEWERAARGDASVAERPYPWGDAAPSCELANYSDDGILCAGGPMPVGAYADVNQSPYGVYEMAGNVWQWTQDWYGETYYWHSPCRNPKGPESGTERVLRGGAWYYLPHSLGVTYRNHFQPTFEAAGAEFGDYRGFGVRCAKDAGGVPCDPAVAECDLPPGVVCLEDIADDAIDSDAASGDAEDAPEDGGGGTDADALDATLDAADGGEASDAADAADGVVVPDAADGELEDVADGFDVEDSGEDVPTLEDVGPDEPDVPEVDCTWPQDKPKNPAACGEVVPPACPSGWETGCANGYCTCVLDTSTEPSACAEEVVDLTLGWRDGLKIFHPFQASEDYEMCQGFQGGGTFHVAVFVQVNDKGLANGATAFTAELHALARVYGIRLGGTSIKKATFTKQPSGIYQSQLIQVVFETCSTASLIGLPAEIDVMIRIGDDKFGRAKVKLDLIDNVNGPYLDPGQSNPC